MNLAKVFGNPEAVEFSGPVEDPLVAMPKVRVVVPLDAALGEAKAMVRELETTIREGIDTSTAEGKLLADKMVGEARAALGICKHDKWLDRCDFCEHGPPRSVP